MVKIDEKWQIIKFYLMINNEKKYHLIWNRGENETSEKMKCGRRWNATSNEKWQNNKYDNVWKVKNVKCAKKLNEPTEE